jgi:iron complex transport system substrate-binding protein
VSLTPAETEILFALGAGDRVVGKVEDIANYPPEAADVPVMGRFDGVDVEQIVDAGADLVLAGGSGGTPRTPSSGFVRSVSRCSLSTQRTWTARWLTSSSPPMPSADPPRARRWSTRCARPSMKWRKATADLERPRVFIETGNQPAIYGIADDSVYAEMIELAGGEAVTTGSATNWEMPVERLVAEDPEIILLADAAYGATADEVRGRPAGTWSRRFATMPSSPSTTSSRRGRAASTEGLQALLAAIHPDVKVGSRRY